MARIGFLCLVLTLYTAHVSVASTTIEIYDGTYYGIEEIDGITSIHVSRQNDTDQLSTDGLVVQPLPTDVDREQFPGHHRRHHHHRHRGGRHGHRHHHGRHHGGPVSEESYHDRANWSEEQKLNHICTKIQMHRRDHHHRGGMLTSSLGQVNEGDRQRLIDLWNSRKQQMLRCCGMSSTDEKLRCIQELRVARYERVCRGEEPLCPWAAYQRGHHGRGQGQQRQENTPSTANTTSTCCARQGSERLECFMEAKQNYRQRMHLFVSRRAPAFPPPPRHGRHEHHELPEDRNEDRAMSRRGGRKYKPESIPSSL